MKRALDVAEIGAQLGRVTVQRGQFAQQFRSPMLQNPYRRVAIHNYPVGEKVESLVGPAIRVRRYQAARS
ncbi:hypothetical protein D3093_19680 (plasmid) [Azospirillum argentinense]|uniref:Uncharacterized protein n=1 Tax=Azospirillum argentinense TaxID=2970906 RepID=A0A4D8PFM8_9PROT|nr:hypothetical protein [Azospirillum argentinense]QCN97453.1 hypothetical protein D3093_19680 [Azospirillum argentinense]